MTFLQELIYVLIPLILSNSIHMVVVKKDLFSIFKIPINRNLFGSNKTIRGFVIVPLLNLFFTIIVLFFLNQLFVKIILLGLIFVLVYMFSELPNSFLKRKIGISPGGQSTKNKWLFILLDKADSALGVAFCYHIFFANSWIKSLIIFLAGSLVHFIFSWILLIFRIKKSF